MFEKYQDVDDDDLHFMQIALLIRRPEAGTPNLHRFIIIIITVTVKRFRDERALRTPKL